MNPQSLTVNTSAEESVILPCKFQPSKEEVVVQVIWMRIKPDGTQDQIITAHHQDGQQGTKHWVNSFVGSNCSYSDGKIISSPAEVVCLLTYKEMNFSFYGSFISM